MEAATHQIGEGATPVAGAGDGGVAAPPPFKRFHGSVAPDATRLARDAGEIAQEVVQHLAGIVGSAVEVTLDVQARVPEGVPENVVRTAVENCATLKLGVSSSGGSDSRG